MTCNQTPDEEIAPDSSRLTNPNHLYFRQIPSFRQKNHSYSIINQPLYDRPCDGKKDKSEKKYQHSKQKTNHTNHHRANNHTLLPPPPTNEHRYTRAITPPSPAHQKSPQQQPKTKTDNKTHHPPSTTTSDIQISQTLPPEPSPDRQ
jgi:hypothetical protein